MNPQEIRAIRQLAGLTQTEFANSLGVTLLTVNRWEKGHSVPAKKNIKKLEKLIGDDNLQIIRTRMTLLETSDSLRKRANDKKGDLKR
ncbi:helix-turn-helix domain-containing protein [Bacillus cereus group sp. TH152-1LC]|uniref:helix-turn-helix domain-containing protein n=1 Tax=Bacillus cereus group sp. TH152-1LC TaxID=3018060 RepID=UPI0022E96B51|nr:helix-turn-helix transcriptional regulator [Bacillus cereus group sp. TH152-1LC]MDA1677030.1 helix-turn-helix transcriptional regulator [Bacillus cereus group sp. TH152-1LC]